jgi:hypothetical protein
MFRLIHPDKLVGQSPRVQFIAARVFEFLRHLLAVLQNRKDHSLSVGNMPAATDFSPYASDAFRT